MTTYPNQKIVQIHKEKCVDNFTQIQNEHMYAASKCLNGSAFKLYMYLASNADGFELALSRKDVIDKTGISHCSYDNAVDSLIKYGYLVFVSGLTYNFNTYPENYDIPKNHDIPKNQDNTPIKIRISSPKKQDSTILKTMKEIDNKDNKDILYIKQEEINSSSNKENNSSKTKKVSRKEQLTEYISKLDFSQETKDVLTKWYFQVGIKGGLTLDQLRDKLQSIDDECLGNENLIREAINQAYLSGWFGFYKPNQTKTIIPTSKPVEPSNKKVVDSIPARPRKDWDDIFAPRKLNPNVEYF